MAETVAIKEVRTAYQARGGTLHHTFDEAVRASIFQVMSEIPRSSSVAPAWFIDGEVAKIFDELLARGLIRVEAELVTPS